MTLITLLLVFALERITTKPKWLQTRFYVSRYLDFLRQRHWLHDDSAAWVFALVVLLPSLVVLGISWQSTSVVFDFALSVTLLALTIGCPVLRANYKGYLQASNRGDTEAASLCSANLGFSPDGYLSFGQYIIWVNFRHYAAVALWFVALGPAGAVLYAVAREVEALSTQVPIEEASATREGNTQEMVAEETASHDAAFHEGGTHQYSQDPAFVSRLLAALDWVPVRLASLGFLMMGHFTQAFPIWFKSLFDLKLSASQHLAQVAKAAEDFNPEADDCTEEPCVLLRLAKRNVRFFLATVAMMTLAGWVH